MDRHYFKEQAESYFEILRNDFEALGTWFANKRAEIISGYRGMAKKSGNLGSNLGGVVAETGGAAESAAAETASFLYEKCSKVVALWIRPTKAKMLGEAILSALLALFVALFMRVSLLDVAAGIFITCYLAIALFLLTLFFTPVQRYVARVVHVDARGVVVDHGGQLEVLKEARGLDVKEGENLIVAVDFAGRRVLGTDEYY